MGRKEKKGKGGKSPFFYIQIPADLAEKNPLPSTSPSSSFSGDCKVVMRGRKGGGGEKLGRGENPVEKKGTFHFEHFFDNFSSNQS